MGSFGENENRTGFSIPVAPLFNKRSRRRNTAPGRRSFRDKDRNYSGTGSNPGRANAPVRSFFSPGRNFFRPKMRGYKKYVYICSPKTMVAGNDLQGEMPEWSIGPHSKCGVRATVPGVRIPLSPQQTLKISKLRNKTLGFTLFDVKPSVLFTPNSIPTTYGLHTQRFVHFSV